ncbi:MAG TPA: hypothetical protein PKA00_01685 [Saprospiraceae bacterium]|nr:hypothetical protein [Saprospiraceae bacterium]HMQ81581.1 hypothetical protein [Saprospiraceae bacterium]
MGLQVNIDEVEKALLNLLKALRNQKGDVIEIEPVDYYWSIDRDDLYDPYNDPTQLTLGQLTDDLQTLKKLANCEFEPVSQDLVKAGAVLAAIGNKTVW